MSITANRVIKNTGILYARMAITVFISLYATRLTLNSLGVSDFGVFNLVAGAIAMLTFLNNAMAGATQRFISFAEGAGDLNKVKVIFSVSIVLHILIAFLVLIVLEIGGYYLFNYILKIPEERIVIAKTIYQFMIVSTLFTIISVPYDSIINAHENMLIFAILGVIEALFKLCIAIYITYTSFDKLLVLGLLTAVSSILLLLARRIYCHKNYAECNVKIKNHFSKPVFTEMTSFAGWAFLGSSSSMVANYGQTIVLNTFFGPIVNGAQGIAVQVNGQLGTFSSTMQKALKPVIDKSEGGGNRQLMLKASMTGSKISFYLLLLFSIPTIIEMPYIFKLWLKNVPDYAIIFCSLQLMRNLIEQLFVTLNSIITAVGNIQRYQITSSILNILPLIISYVLFDYGLAPFVLYIIYIVYAILSSIVSLYFSSHLTGMSIKEYVREVIEKSIYVLIIAFPLPLILNLTIKESILRLLIICFSSILCTLLTIKLIGLNEQENIEVKNLIKKIPDKLGLNKKTVKSNNGAINI